MILHRLLRLFSVASFLCVTVRSQERDLFFKRVVKDRREGGQENSSPSYGDGNLHSSSLKSRLVSVCQQFSESLNTQELDEVYEDLVKLVKNKAPEEGDHAMNLIEDYGELFGQDAFLFGLGPLYDDVEARICREGRQCVTIGDNRNSLFFAKPSVVWASMIESLQGMELSEVESMSVRNANPFP
ncbi:MAG: hypothetical protein VX737_00715 [Pseudomonadota bacterium]|nr:hypothetical protein [Pseudomonadota bacterium]